MATLTPEQLDFLKSHHIPLDKTFDASGLSSKEYKAKMKKNGALVAYGVPPCPKGHTLKNKQANCLQCNPQAIASIKRQATAGDVYIAVSPSQLLAKISVIADASSIEQTLNQQAHAGITDWQIAMIAHTPSIGQVENHLQHRLAEYQVAKKLSEHQKVTKASAIYAVDVHEALEILNELALEVDTLDTDVLDNFQARYQNQVAQAQQQAQQRLLEQQARAQQALEEQVRQNQQQLAEQQQAQQILKQQKQAQKKQRQQALDAKKSQKQPQTPLTQTADIPANRDGEHAPNTNPTAKLQRSTSGLLERQKPLIWLVVAIAVALVILVMVFAIMK